MAVTGSSRAACIAGYNGASVAMIRLAPITSSTSSGCVYRKMVDEVDRRINGNPVPPIQHPAEHQAQHHAERGPAEPHQNPLRQEDPTDRRLLEPHREEDADLPRLVADHHGERADH